MLSMRSKQIQAIALIHTYVSTTTALRIKYEFEIFSFVFFNNYNIIIIYIERNNKCKQSVWNYLNKIN